MIAFINSPFQAYVLKCYLQTLNTSKAVVVIIREYNKVMGLSDTTTIKRCLSGKNIKYIVVRDGLSKLQIILILVRLLQLIA